MKLNWGERLAVNNPLRPVQQGLELRWLLRQAPLPSGVAILEIGCGRGAGARLILRRCRPTSLVISDLDPEMIAMARRYLSPAERERAAMLVGDAERLPLGEGRFDAVFGFGVLHHLPDWRAGAAEIARVLKPGGRYFFEELYPSLYQNALTRRFLLHPTEDRFRGPDLRAGLAAAGLPVQRAMELSLVGILGVARKNP